MKELQHEKCRILALAVIAQAMRDFKFRALNQAKMGLKIGDSRFFTEKDSDIGFWCTFGELSVEAVKERYAEVKRQIENKRRTTWG